MQQQLHSPTILTVSQLTHAIKHCLESSFPHVWLQGEVSNFKAQTSGHFYFSLKDQTAQIAAVMFRAEASQLKLIPKDGAQIIIRGELNLYPQSGKY
ncbi:MAG: exodeoxyribonuclease VII large subunit, partial [Parachlamydiaceae bacterium]